MSDYSGKVYRKIGGDEIVVEAGGKITIGNIMLTRDADGNWIVSGLPTADPSVAGALYSNAGVLTVSAG